MHDVVDADSPVREHACSGTGDGPRGGACPPRGGLHRVMRRQLPWVAVLQLY